MDDQTSGGDFIAQTLELHFLGGFHATAGGQPLSSGISPRLQALIAYLLLHRDAPQPRRYLAFQLWPDSSEPQARTNLRNLLHVFRESIPGAERFLLSDTQTVQWNPQSAFTADIVEFEAASAAARSTGALQSAVDMYAGELLPDCYDDWIQPERERLRERFVDVLERLTQSLEQEGEYRASIRYTERLLRIDPLREDSYRRLMRLYAKSGDRLGVVRVYQTCANVLKRELDAEVSQITQAAYEELVHLEVVPPPTADMLPARLRAGNLPLPLTSFIGREQVIADLQQVLSRGDFSHPRTRLLTLTGAGGCGKTRLATELASRMQDEFRDGAWMVELAPLSDPSLFLQDVARVFGLPEQKRKPLTDTLVRYFETKSLLLILDNCEHLLDSCARLVQKLLETCLELKIIITSREPLNLPGEVIWRVPPLSVPDENAAGQFEVIRQFEAVQLFVERASAVLPTFELNHQNAASIAQICRHLDGIPLAIELAAARARSWPVEQILARLADRFELLSNGSRTALARHQTMWNLIDWSYGLLPETERALLRRLVVFSGGWTLAAAEQICSDPEPELQPGAGIPPDGVRRDGVRPDGVRRDGVRPHGVRRDDVLDLLTHLVDQSLITYNPTEAQTRYHMYESIRAYGWERLRQSGEDQATRQRHSQYYLQWLDDLHPQLHGPRQVAVLREIDDELDNFRELFGWLQQQPQQAQQAGLRLVGSLAWFWVMRGYILQGRRWIEEAFRKLPIQAQEPSTILARALFGAGVIAFFQFDHRAAYAWSERSASMWQLLGDPLEAALARALVAYILFTDGEEVRANAIWAADEPALLGQKDFWGLGWVLSLHARAERDTNHFDLARSIYLESARMLQAAGDEWMLAIINSHVGQIEYRQGNYASARERYEMRLETGRKMHSITHLRIAHFWLAEIARKENDAERAAFHYKEDLRLEIEFGDLMGYIDNLAGLAWVSGAKGRWREAVMLYAVAERILDQCTPAGDQDESRAMIQQELSHALDHLGETSFREARSEGQSLTVEQAIALIPE